MDLNELYLKMEYLFKSISDKFGNDIFQKYWYNLQSELYQKDTYLQYYYSELAESLECNDYREIMNYSFNWANTKEGGDFWNKISDECQKYMTYVSNKLFD